MPARSQGESRHHSDLGGRYPYEAVSLTGAWTSVGGWRCGEFVVENGVEGRGVRVRMTRISRSVEVGTPNPVSRRDGVTIWQMRRISNCVQSFASIRCRSCASTSQQNSVRLEGIDSGDICGQRSWDVPNNAISARACSFMWRMRADEENTIMPESGEERRGCGIEPVPWRATSCDPETSFCRELNWFCWEDCGTRILSAKWSSDSARVAPKRQV